MTKVFIMLDRDGTLNVERHYLSDPDQLALYPGVGQALKRLRDHGFGLVVLTNQSGLARGYFDRATLDRIHAKLQEMLTVSGGEVDAIYFCPHEPKDGCDCRKPLTGLVDQAVADWGFDPRRSVMIGDKEADIDLGRAVGARTILLRTGWGADTEKAGLCQPDLIVDTLDQAVEWILAQRGISP